MENLSATFLQSNLVGKFATKMPPPTTGRKLQQHTFRLINWNIKIESFVFHYLYAWTVTPFFWKLNSCTVTAFKHV